jgi:DNA-binding response OmpR family regulator
MSAVGTDRSENALRILVIEDERKLAGAIAEGLEGNGYEVALADSGEAGIRQLRNSAFDLVLLDVMLPRQGGLETLREMRRSGFTNPGPDPHFTRIGG